MSQSIISEGKTTNEAIENGLKKLKVTRDMVDIKVMENDEKRSFFSILAPRIVKVELTVREIKEKDQYEKKEEIHFSGKDLEIAKKDAEQFMSEILTKLSENAQYNIEADEEGVKINITGENIGFLIGYRGETLYSLQTIISAIANKSTEKRVRILLDIDGYRNKREQTLKELAQKKARIVEKTRKSITLEPMHPYERKIIHTVLQDNKKISTTSIGEEPRRRIVISFKR